MNSMTCLFCLSKGPFNKEHVIPESLGNDDLILEGQVCCQCNSHFSRIEQFVLHKTPIAFWRTYLGIKTKRGALPSVDLSQPNKNKGIFPGTHPRHDNGIGFTAHEDGSVSVEVENDETIRGMLTGDREQFNLVMTPLVLFNLSRFLCKIGIELECMEDANRARSGTFTAVRHYARYGSTKDLWPIFHYQDGELQELKRRTHDSEGVLEEVDCYRYALYIVCDHYSVVHLTTGLDNWVVCLNEQFPGVHFKKAFERTDINCIWYSAEEIGFKQRKS